MNQVTNLIQFKNLSIDQQAELDFENYEYEEMAPLSDGWIAQGRPFIHPFEHTVYRLKIEPDKYYYARVKTIPNTRLDTMVKIGSEFSDDFIKDCCDFRPATVDEQPKQEPTGEDLVGAVCYCGKYISEISSYVKSRGDYYSNDLALFTGKPKPVSVAELERWLEKARELER